MCHETIRALGGCWDQDHGYYLVILSNIDLGSKMKVGSVTLFRSAPGRSCDMMWERTAAAGLISIGTKMPAGAVARYAALD